MKTNLFPSQIILTLSLFSCLPHSVSAQTIGRTIQNAETEERLELVCLDSLEPNHECLHFQLRETKNSTPQFIGSEMIVKSQPDAQFEQDAIQAAKLETPPKKNKFMPWFNHIVRLDGYVNVGAVLMMATFMSPVTTADFILSIAKTPLIGLKNVLRSIKRKGDQKKIASSVADLFDESKVNASLYRLNDRQYKILKNSLLSNMN